MLQTSLAFNFIPIIVGLSGLLQSIDFRQFQERYERNEILIMKSLKELKSFLGAQNVPLIGIEIAENAKSILLNPFTISIALMPGNEGVGLSASQVRSCDDYIYVPQYGQGIESLNVNVASAIVLNQYTEWLRTMN